MDQNQLTTFITVAKHLSFSEAARELYLSQPTVSHQISSLEKELNTLLFNREAKGISLTDSGKLFLDDAKGLLNMAANVFDHIHSLEKTRGSSLSIAYLLPPCHSFLPAVIADFQKQYPQVELRIHRTNIKEMLQAMASQQYDLFFTVTHDLENYSKYNYKTIFKDSMSMIFPNCHPCAKSGKIDFDNLASEPFLMLNSDVAPSISNQVMRFLHSKKCFPSNIKQFDTMEEILFEVEAGLGITILPSRNQFLYQYSLTYIPIEGIYSTMEIGVAWMKTSENPAVSWFLELLDSTPPQKKFRNNINSYKSLHPRILSIYCYPPLPADRKNSSLNCFCSFNVK